MRWPIRNQLLLPLVLLLVGIVGITAWTAIGSADRARRQIETQVRSVARTLSEASFPLNQHVLEHMRGLSGAEFVLVTDDGASGTLSPPPDELPPPEAVAEHWESLRLGPRIVAAGQTYLGSGIRIRSGGPTLYALYPETLWRDAMWRAVEPPLAVGSFMGLAALVVAASVGRRLHRRVRDLEHRTRLIAAGDFRPVPLAGHDDELRDLAHSVNEMAQRLAQLQDAVQKNERMRLLGQVSGGLAHQLRNSATGARLAVQLHARECGNGEERETLDVALRELSLLEANLKRFLDLGRSGLPAQESCVLNNLITETVSLLAPRCRHAGIALQWQPPARDVRTVGDTSQLGHVLLNLLTNAVEAAGPGGSLEVGLTCPQTNGDCTIEVWDSGPGPPRTVAERLFEPFVTGKPEGVGLGLAVARQVVEAHHGRIDWRREDDRTCFRITLPRDAGSPSR
jgi:signal transduction histidine kinase